MYPFFLKRSAKYIRKKKKRKKQNANNKEADIAVNVEIEQVIYIEGNVGIEYETDEKIIDNDGEKCKEEISAECCYILFHSIKLLCFQLKTFISEISNIKNKQTVNKEISQ